MSLAGLTSPSTWVTSSSRKTRVTWQIAADSRMWERNLLPRPSPSEAPRTMPAMSTNSTVAGRICAEPNTSASFGSRSSGTPDDADVRLDGRERVVRREDVVLGQRVEEGRLARVGESDDADGECHGRRVYGATRLDQRAGRIGPLPAHRVEHLDVVTDRIVAHGVSDQVTRTGRAVPARLAATRRTVTPSARCRVTVGPAPRPDRLMRADAARSTSRPVVEPATTSSCSAAATPR